MNRGPCTVDGCDRQAWARQLCHAHYQKLQRYGTPLGGKEGARKGAGYIDKDGYHRRCVDGVEKPEHVRIVESVIGKPLPPGAVVHHWDENKANNSNANLLVCPDDAYHKLIHARMRALAACGNANWRKCCRCGEYDDKSNLSLSGSQAYHLACNAAHVRRMTQQKRHLTHAT